MNSVVISNQKNTVAAKNFKRENIYEKGENV